MVCACGWPGSHSVSTDLAISGHGRWFRIRTALSTAAVCVGVGWLSPEDSACLGVSPGVEWRDQRAVIVNCLSNVCVVSQVAPT